MPLRIFCKQCGELLYEGTDLVLASAFKKKHGETCKNCGHELEDKYTVRSIGPHQEDTT